MKTTVQFLALAGLLTALAPVANAQEPVDTAPPPPPSAEDAEQIEPEVTIIRREDKTIEEYRVNGRLYMIKIVPQAGPPYYLIDRDGNGSFESRRAGGELEPGLSIPNWVLFRW